MLRKALLSLCAVLVLGLVSVQASAQFTAPGPFRFYESPEIDGTATGTTEIYTTITETSFDRVFYPVGAAAIMTDVGNLLTPSVISIGKDSPSYNDIVTATAVGTVVGKIKLFALAGDLEKTPEGTVLKIKVITAATALTGSPTCKFKVVVFGYDRVE